MSDRPTPETDAVWDDKSQNILEHARRLERERDEAREELDELNKRLIEVCQYGVVCTIEREDLRKEVAELKEARK